MTIDEARASIGRRVEYRPPHPALPSEAGVITSVSDRFAFVRYDGETASKATPPEHLTLLGAGPGN